MSLKRKCDIAYERGEPIMSDAEYDAMFGDDASAMQNANVSKDGVALPVWMGSLDKTRSEKSLESFLKRMDKAPSFVVSCKLDGISALYDPFQKRLYTRGNGIVGMDITRFLKYINIDPKILRMDVYVRGELIMPKKTFETKYKTEFKNPRNLVAGQFSRKQMNKSILKDVYFVPYEIIVPSEKLQPSPSQQFETLDSSKNLMLWETIPNSDVTVNYLTDILEKWERTSKFMIDGLVLAVNLPYVRIAGGNPKHAIAFKRETDIDQRETTVTGVEWNVSKWGVLVPTVIVKPVEISGVTISKLAGHNAKYILDNKIGPGAKIICVRSGDVIPYILSVVKESPHEIELPSSTWAGVNLMAEDEDDAVEIKTLTTLFVGLGVKDVSLKTFEKMYVDCHLTTFPKMLNCTKRDLSRVFGDKTTEKILDRMYELKSKPIDVPKIVGYSGVLGYGLGVKRVEKLLEDLGDIYKIPSKNRVIRVEGFSEKTAEKVVENYSMMLKFLDLCVSNGLKFASKKKKNPNVLKVCMTGFRDKSLEDACILSSSVTKDCDYLVCKDKTKESGKTKKAKQLGVKIVSKDEFERILRR
jgi:NAD-dependent DNA ligase